MSDYLPEEVLIEIFLKLPIKSILQCTSLSKSWYSLITSPTFISQHLNLNQGDDYLFVRHLHGKELYALFRDNENFDNYALSDDFPFDSELHFNVVGICNGILCLCNDMRFLGRKVPLKIPNLYLWNPSIRKSIKLPTPIFEFGTSNALDINHKLGFGFDHAANDYKVVRIMHTLSDKLSTGFREIITRVELYKLSTGVWQDITNVAPPYHFLPHIPGVYVNGAFHWVASQRKQGAQNMIVLFDMHDETFREMMVPSCLAMKPGWLFCDLIFFLPSEKSIAFAEIDDIIVIWMMEEYGDPKSWVKKFSINAGINVFYIVPMCEFHHMDKPLALRKNGEIFWRTHTGFLVSYDLTTGKLKNVDIHASKDEYRDSLYVNTYRLSLTLLDKQTKLHEGP